MKIAVVLSHGGASGGVRHLRMIAAQLAARGHSVRVLVLERRFGAGCGEEVVPWHDLPLAVREAEVLLGPGDLPLSTLVPSVGARVIALFLHLGVHDWNIESANIRHPQVEKMTTARWIQCEIRALGAPCAWIGIAPLEEGLAAKQKPDAAETLRVGTLAHAWYGWKNTAAAVDAYQRVRREFPTLELVSYGLVKMPIPGTSVVAPDIEERQRLYASCRVWLSPSISEGLGMAAFEAMLCGTPVISADNRGIREFADESTCAMYRSNDLDALAEHLRAALRNPQPFTERAVRARRRVESYRWPDCAARIEAVLRRAPRNEAALHGRG